MGDISISPSSHRSTPPWNFYRLSAEGEEAQKIDLAVGSFRHFTVHPDGQRIAFSSLGAHPEHAQVWVMENFLPADKAKK